MTLNASHAELQTFLESSSQWPDFHNYRDLDESKREIRLLNLYLVTASEAVHGGQQSGIHITIHHASLDDADVDYEAISHYWGPPCSLETIFVDGQRVRVRRTLYNLLDALCHMKRSQPIWLDVLCINQNNTAERNWQVSMMGDIYKRAACVRAWIGVADADSDYALDYVRFHKENALLTSSRLQEIRSRARQSLAQLASRPYWRRLWVVQEIGLGRSISVTCGDRSVDWTDIFEAVKSLFDIGKLNPNAHDNVRLHTKLSLQSDASIEPFLNLNDLRTSLRRFTASAQDPASSEVIDEVLTVSMNRQIEESRKLRAGKNVSVLQRVRQFQGYKCQDPRDKIFGLLSTVSSNHNIAVDYTKSLSDVLFDMLTSAEPRLLTGSITPQTEVEPELVSFNIAELATEAHAVLEDLDLDEIQLMDNSICKNPELWLPLPLGNLNARIDLICTIVYFMYTLYYNPVDTSQPDFYSNVYKRHTRSDGSASYVKLGDLPILTDLVFGINLQDLPCATNLTTTSPAETIHFIVRPYRDGPSQLIGVWSRQSQYFHRYISLLFHAFHTGDIEFCSSPGFDGKHVWHYLHFSRAAFLTLMACLPAYGGNRGIESAQRCVKKFEARMSGPKISLCHCQVDDDQVAKIAQMMDKTLMIGHMPGHALSVLKGVMSRDGVNILRSMYENHELGKRVLQDLVTTMQDA